jgi:predicted membrane chloride channel (bestrophin family)
MSLWMFLLFLPFQVVTPMGWVTIPGTAFASFLLLGFLEIGQEIENPFDYEMNDLGARFV